MADNVPITAGSGTNIATDDVSAVHYQIVKLADGTLNSTALIGGDATNGLDVDVTRLPALVAGTANIGDVDIVTMPNVTIGTMAALVAGSANIGDVDVLSVVPGTSGTSLGKAEDAGHTTGDTGVMALGVRNDANASLAGTDLDYVPLSTDAAGNSNVLIRKHKVRSSLQSAGLTIATTAYTAGDQVGSIFTLTGMSRASGGTGTIRSVVLLDVNDIIGAYDVVLYQASVTLAADNAAFSVSDADMVNIIGVVQLAGSFDMGANRIGQAYNLDLPYVCSGGTSIYAALIARAGHTFFTATTDLRLITVAELD